MKTTQHKIPTARPSSQRPLSAVVKPVGARPVIGGASSDRVIEFRGVTKLYEGGDIGLDHATFGVEQGEFVFLVGHTGSGKSTIMRLLIKEVQASSGVVNVAGHDLAEIKRKKVPYYRRNIGVVWQDFKLLPNRTVYNNVAYALLVTGHSRKQIREKVPDILRLTGLSTKLHNYPDQLSGGEQQRVSIARAFVNHPPLLLCDEPTGNLDTTTSREILKLLAGLPERGKRCVVMVTHDPSAAQYGTRLVKIRDGLLESDEPVK